MQRNVIYIQDIVWEKYKNTSWFKKTASSVLKNVFVKVHIWIKGNIVSTSLRTDGTLDFEGKTVEIVKH